VSSLKDVTTTRQEHLHSVQACNIPLAAQHSDKFLMSCFGVRQPTVHNGTGKTVFMISVRRLVNNCFSPLPCLMAFGIPRSTCVVFLGSCEVMQGLRAHESLARSSGSQHAPPNHGSLPHRRQVFQHNLRLPSHSLLPKLF